MHAERLLQSTGVPSLVLIAQAVFLLDRGQTDKQTDATQRTPYPRLRLRNNIGENYEHVTSFYYYLCHYGYGMLILCK